MLASSRKPCHTANPRRRAKSPALHCGRDRAADERPLSVKHAGGPMRSSAPAQGRAAACHPRRCCMPALPCRAGVHARRKGLRRPEGYWQGRAPHPSAACGGTSPCRGGFMGNCCMGRLPCKGSCLRQQTEGCIAGSRRGYPVKFGRPCPASARSHPAARYWRGVMPKRALNWRLKLERLSNPT